MTFNLSVSLLVILSLLMLSAFLAGSETALTAVSKARMHRLAAAGSWRAKQAINLIADRERLIGALLLGNTFINILASALATAAALAYFGNGGVVIATLAMTAIILIFTEVLPKTLAITHTDRFALAVAAVVRLFVSFLAPIVSAVRWMVWRVLNLFGIRADEDTPVLSAHEEIRGAIELHHQEGGVEREHADMLGGVLDLKDLQLADVMVHRKNMEVLDGNAPPEEIVERVLSSSHTRFPIWRDDPENIVGVLHLKVLVRTLIERRGSLKNLDIVSLAAEPWYVPDTTTLEEQLSAFRERREHFAFVVDEYGVLQGLVTLEDILEEVFGKISEGRQAPEAEHIRPQADGSFNVDGVMPIRELNRQLNWALPDDAATTIAGLVISEAHAIPDVGQAFAFCGFKFEILRRQRNQIIALRIVPPAPEPEVVDDASG
jgi:Mg2+/Co2+ transporter CorB